MSWDVVNLGNLPEREKVQPTLGGVGLVYPGKRHLFSGPQESAKTLCAYAIVLNDVRGVGRALVIDFEMGMYDARDRLLEMGATPQDFDRISYVDPDTPLDETALHGLLACEPTLVIIDAASGAMALEGLDDNKRKDVAYFLAAYVDAFWLRDVATIVLDHVVKQADQRGKYAIGSERKAGGVDVHLGFAPIQELKRGGTGRFKLTNHKDRFGWLPRGKAAELVIRSNPDSHALSWTFQAPAPDDDKQEAPFRPTRLMERVSRYLEHQAEPVSRNTVETAVIGKTRWLREAVDRLLDEGYLGESKGPRNARLLLSKQAYRQDDLVPHLVPPERDALVPDLVPHEPPNQAVSDLVPDLVPASSQTGLVTSSLNPSLPTGETVQTGRRRAGTDANENLTNRPSAAGTETDGSAQWSQARLNALRVALDAGQVTESEYREARLRHFRLRRIELAIEAEAAA